MCAAAQKTYRVVLLTTAVGRARTLKTDIDKLMLKNPAKR